MSRYSFPPAIKQPSIIPYKIQGKDAPAFLRDFNGLVDSDFGGNAKLKVLSLSGEGDNAEVTGSNTLVLPVVQILIPDKRIGRPEDLQRTLNDGDTLSIVGNHYVDLGAVLDFTGRNHEMAKDFYEQLSPEARRDFIEKGLPASVVGYGLKNFTEGSYKLGLVNTANTRLNPSELFKGKTRQFNNTDVSLETGLPTRLEGGERTFYTASQKVPSIENLGLSWLYLGGSLGLDSSIESLAGSNSYGRVVLF